MLATNLPEGHSAQPALPVNGWYWPAAQTAQLDESPAPVLARNDPGAQLAHSTAPLVAW